VRDLLLGDAPLGDVLVRGDPAAAAGRMVEDRDRAAVLQLDDQARVLAPAQHLEQALDVGIGIAGKRSARHPHGQKLAQGAARPDLVRRQRVHLDIAPIADQQPRRGVEHDQALRHVLDRGLEHLPHRLHFRGAFVDQPLEAAIHILDLFDHERDRALVMAAVAVRFRVGRADEGAQCAEIDASGHAGRFRELIGEELVHELAFPSFDRHAGSVS
jgi:hypothetical protein